MPPLVYHAYGKEEPAGADTVVDHLEHATVKPMVVHGKDPCHNSTEVAHAGICHKLFYIRLGHGKERTVYDAGHREYQNKGCERNAGIREEREIEPQKTVCPHLKEDSGQYHATCGGCLHMSIRKPSVEGEDRHLYGEA